MALSGAKITHLKKGVPNSSLDITSDSVTLGSDLRCTIRIHKNDVQRKHCIIQRSGSKIILINCSQSKNVLVNDEYISTEVELQDNSVISISSRQFLWRYDSSNLKNKYRRVTTFAKRQGNNLAVKSTTRESLPVGTYLPTTEEGFEKQIAIVKPLQKPKSEDVFMTQCEDTGNMSAGPSTPVLDTSIRNINKSGAKSLKSIKKTPSVTKGVIKAKTNLLEKLSHSAPRTRKSIQPTNNRRNSVAAIVQTIKDNIKTANACVKQKLSGRKAKRVVSQPNITRDRSAVKRKFSEEEVIEINNKKRKLNSPIIDAKKKAALMVLTGADQSLSKPAYPHHNFALQIPNSFNFGSTTNQFRDTNETVGKTLQSFAKTRNNVQNHTDVLSENSHTDDFKKSTPLRMNKPKVSLSKRKSSSISASKIHSTSQDNVLQITINEESVSTLHNLDEKNLYAEQSLSDSPVASFCKSKPQEKGITNLQMNNQSNINISQSDNLDDTSVVNKSKLAESMQNKSLRSAKKLNSTRVSIHSHSLRKSNLNENLKHTMIDETSRIQTNNSILNNTKNQSEKCLDITAASVGRNSIIEENQNSFATQFNNQSEIDMSQTDNLSDISVDNNISKLAESTQNKSLRSAQKLNNTRFSTNSKSNLNKSMKHNMKDQNSKEKLNKSISNDTKNQSLKDFDITRSIINTSQSNLNDTSIVNEAKLPKFVQGKSSSTKKLTNTRVSKYHSPRKSNLSESLQHTMKVECSKIKLNNISSNDTKNQSLENFDITEASIGSDSLRSSMIEVNQNSVVTQFNNQSNINISESNNSNDTSVVNKSKLAESIQSKSLRSAKKINNTRVSIHSHSPRKSNLNKSLKHTTEDKSSKIKLGNFISPNTKNRSLDDFDTTATSIISDALKNSLTEENQNSFVNQLNNQSKVNTSDNINGTLVVDKSKLAESMLSKSLRSAKKLSNTRISTNSHSPRKSILNESLKQTMKDESSKIKLDNGMSNKTKNQSSVNFNISAASIESDSLRNSVMEVIQEKSNHVLQACNQSNINKSLTGNVNDILAVEPLKTRSSMSLRHSSFAGPSLETSVDQQEDKLNISTLETFINYATKSQFQSTPLTRKSMRRATHTSLQPQTTSSSINYTNHEELNKQANESASSNVLLEANQNFQPSSEDQNKEVKRNISLQKPVLKNPLSQKYLNKRKSTSMIMKSMEPKDKTQLNISLPLQSRRTLRQTNTLNFILKNKILNNGFKQKSASVTTLSDIENQSLENVSTKNESTLLKKGSVRNSVVQNQEVNISQSVLDPDENLLATGNESMICLNGSMREKSFIDESLVECFKDESINDSHDEKYFANLETPEENCTHNNKSISFRKSFRNKSLKQIENVKNNEVILLDNQVKRKCINTSISESENKINTSFPVYSRNRRISNLLNQSVSNGMKMRSRSIGSKVEALNEILKSSKTITPRKSLNQGGIINNDLLQENNLSVTDEHPSLFMDSSRSEIFENEQQSNLESKLEQYVSANKCFSNEMQAQEDDASEMQHLKQRRLSKRASRKSLISALNEEQSANCNELLQNERSSAIDENDPSFMESSRSEVFENGQQSNLESKLEQYVSANKCFSNEMQAQEDNDSEMQHLKQRRLSKRAYCNESQSANCNELLQNKKSSTIDENDPSFMDSSRSEIPESEQHSNLESKLEHRVFINSSSNVNNMSTRKSFSNDIQEGNTGEIQLLKQRRLSKRKSLEATLIEESRKLLNISISSGKLDFTKNSLLNGSDTNSMSMLSGTIDESKNKSTALLDDMNSSAGKINASSKHKSYMSATNLLEENINNIKEKDAITKTNKTEEIKRMLNITLPIRSSRATRKNLSLSPKIPVSQIESTNNIIINTENKSVVDEVTPEANNGSNSFEKEINYESTPISTLKAKKRDIMQNNTEEGDKKSSGVPDTIVEVISGSEEESVTPKTNLKIIPDVAKKLHSTAKKSISRRTLNTEKTVHPLAVIINSNLSPTELEKSDCELSSKRLLKSSEKLQSANGNNSSKVTFLDISGVCEIPSYSKSPENLTNVADVERLLKPRESIRSTKNERKDLSKNSFTLKNSKDARCSSSNISKLEFSETSFGKIASTPLPLTKESKQCEGLNKLNMSNKSQGHSIRRSSLRKSIIKLKAQPRGRRLYSDSVIYLHENQNPSTYNSKLLSEITHPAITTPDSPRLFKRRVTDPIFKKLTAKKLRRKRKPLVEAQSKRTLINKCVVVVTPLKNVQNHKASEVDNLQNISEMIIEETSNSGTTKNKSAQSSIEDIKQSSLNKSLGIQKENDLTIVESEDAVKRKHKELSNVSKEILMSDQVPVEIEDIPKRITRGRKNNVQENAVLQKHKISAMKSKTVSEKDESKEFQDDTKEIENNVSEVNMAQKGKTSKADKKLNQFVDNAKDVIPRRGTRRNNISETAQENDVSQKQEASKETEVNMTPAKKTNRKNKQKNQSMQDDEEMISKRTTRRNDTEMALENKVVPKRSTRSRNNKAQVNVSQKHEFSLLEKIKESENKTIDLSSEVINVSKSSNKRTRQQKSPQTRRDEDKEKVDVQENERVSKRIKKGKSQSNNIEQDVELQVKETFIRRTTRRRKESGSQEKDNAQQKPSQSSRVEDKAKDDLQKDEKVSKKIKGGKLQSNTIVQDIDLQSKETSAQRTTRKRIGELDHPQEKDQAQIKEAPIRRTRRNVEVLSEEANEETPKDITRKKEKSKENEMLSRNTRKRKKEENDIDIEKDGVDEQSNLKKREVHNIRKKGKRDTDEVLENESPTTSKAVKQIESSELSEHNTRSKQNKKNKLDDKVNENSKLEISLKALRKGRGKENEKEKVFEEVEDHQMGDESIKRTTRGTKKTTAENEHIPLKRSTRANPSVDKTPQEKVSQARKKTIQVKENESTKSTTPIRRTRRNK